MNNLAPGTTIGPYPYRVVRLIGHRQGAMSYIYLASVGEDSAERPANLVVLKIVRTDSEHGDFYRKTLENEVDRLRRLKHPGIVRLFPIEKRGLRNLPYMAQADLPGRPWFSVMEYLAGGSLADLISQQKRLDVGFALEIARSLAITLDYLHHLQQVHLDIKPQNVLFREVPRIGSEIQAVLIDFGICRNVGQGGLEAGTLQWSAPERIIGTRGTEPPEVTVRPHPAMDVYALGLILYQMIAGRLPYEGRTRKSITEAILQGQPTRPSAYQPLVKPELDDLILAMLAREPAQRPRAHEVAVALEELSIRLGYRPRYGYITQGVQVQPSNPTSRSRWPGRLAFASLAGLLIAETAFLAYLRPWSWLWNNSPSSSTAETATVLSPPESSAVQVVEVTATPTVIPSTSTLPVSTPTPMPQAASDTPRSTPTNGYAEHLMRTPKLSQTPTETLSPTPTPVPTSTPVSTHTPTPTRAMPTATPTMTPTSP